MGGAAVNSNMYAQMYVSMYVIYVNEYTTAKKAIDKYKEENIIENIITQKDDYSYN